MKKGFFMMGVAALALASCAQEEVIETSPSNVNQREIGFEMYVGNPTKAVIDNATLNEFKVWGGYDGVLNNVFSDLQIDKPESGNVWKPAIANAQYWVPDKQYYFAAYAPVTGVGTVSANVDNKNLDFKGVIINATAQNDLIYATANKKTDNPIEVDPGSVALNFDHVLSMIKVTITSGFNAQHKITVSNLKIAGMNSTGDFSGATKKWSNQNTPDVTGFTGWADDAASTGGEGTAESNEFIVMPQTLAADAVTITFDAVVTDANNEEVGSHSFKGTLSDAWVESNRYNYTVTLTPEMFQDGDDDDQDIFEITFTPDVSDWNDWTDTGITVQ